MLQFFRKNDPYTLLWIFLLLVIIRLTWAFIALPVSFLEWKWLLLGSRLAEGHLMYQETYDYTAPLAALVYKWMGVLFGMGRWGHFLLTTVVIMVQASILNHVLLKNGAYEENNYVPALIYVLLMSAVADFYVLSPQLMSLTFVLLSLNQIFRRIDNVVTDDLFLYAGIYTGLATMFYLPSVVFFFVFLISFVIFSSAVFRRLMLFVYGFVLVGGFVALYYFWFDALGDFWESAVVVLFLKPKIFFLSYWELFASSYLLIAFLVLCLIASFSLRVTSFQQKVVRVMVLFCISALVMIPVSNELSTANLTYFIPPLAFFLTHYLLSLKRRFFKPTVPYLVILCILMFPLYQQRHLKGYFMQSEKHLADAKRLLVLGTNYSLYQGNVIASPFIDEYLSTQKLRGLDYYEEAKNIYQHILDSDPEVIIDEWGTVPLLFQRFPDIREAYTLQPDGYYWKHPTE